MFNSYVHRKRLNSAAVAAHSSAKESRRRRTEQFKQRRLKVAVKERLTMWKDLNYTQRLTQSNA